MWFYRREDNNKAFVTKRWAPHDKYNLRFLGEGYSQVDLCPRIDFSSIPSEEIDSHSLRGDLCSRNPPGTFVSSALQIRDVDPSES
jgi:hypothetical protein